MAARTAVADFDLSAEGPARPHSVRCAVELLTHFFKLLEPTNQLRLKR